MPKPICCEFQGPHFSIWGQYLGNHGVAGRVSGDMLASGFGFSSILMDLRILSGPVQVSSMDLGGLGGFGPGLTRSAFRVVSGYS